MNENGKYRIMQKRKEIVSEAKKKVNQTIMKKGKYTIKQKKKNRKRRIRQ